MNRDTKAPDRRIQRTRRALSDALLSLLPERGWDNLSVQDICDRANVGRSTFYVHFQGKDELLVGSLDDLRVSLVNQPTCTGHHAVGSQFAFVYGLIEHIREQRTLCRSLFGRRSGHAVQVRFQEMVTRMFADSLPGTAPRWRHEAATRFLAGALVELLAWWVDTYEPCSMDDVTRHFFRLAHSAMIELGEHE